MFYSGWKNFPGLRFHSNNFPKPLALRITRSFAPAKQIPAGKKLGKARPQQPKARDQGLSGPLGKQENGGKAGKGAVPALPPAPAAPAGKVWRSRDVALERIQPGTKAWDAAKGIFPARGTTQGMLRSRDEGSSNGRPFLPTKTWKGSGFSWIWG